MSNNNNNNQNSNPINWSNIATTGLGMLGNVLGNQNAFSQQQQLMGIQFQNQRLLNEQAHQLGKDMWDYTNYGNQVKHMKDAGLNVGLMYGGGGGGGSTTSQPSGGGASGGNAPMPMDIMNMVNQAKLTQAQIENINADTKLKEVDANKRSGVDTEEAQSRIDLNKIKTRFETENLPIALEQTKADLDNTFADTKKKVAEGTISEIDAKTQNWKNVSYVLNTIMSTKQMSESIKQKWKDLEIAKQNADSATRNADTNYRNYVNEVLKKNLQDFKTNIEAEYPSVWNVVGKIFNDGIVNLESLFGKNEEYYDKSKQTIKTTKNYK